MRENTHCPVMTIGLYSKIRPIQCRWSLNELCHMTTEEGEGCKDYKDQNDMYRLSFTFKA